ncbi:MAG: STAS domain-containing protein [Gammaproteobacteria bacterium]|nr:STAS domain-containing protein [Gammaproteobacteria bacterium]
MSTPEIRFNGGTLQVSGELNLKTVPDALSQFESLPVTSAESVLIDLGGVTRSDSAGVALLIEYIRQLRLADVPVTVSHLPAQMQEMAQLSGLDQLLEKH